MFSKASEYGIKAAIHISQKTKQGERVNLKAVAKAIDSPVAFTAKILQEMVNNNIIFSIKGPNGGYEIPDVNQGIIKLYDIVQTFDGDKFYNGCGLGLKRCNARKPCPLHDKFKTVREDMKNMLESTTISELTCGLEEGVAFLKR